MNMDYYKLCVKYFLINDEGLIFDDVLYLYFDVFIGNDYFDGDEWFGVEYLFFYNIKLFDCFVGFEYFTIIYVVEAKYYWRYRELIRFKYGKLKKLFESLEFVNRKYRDLSKFFYDFSVLDEIIK